MSNALSRRQFLQSSLPLFLFLQRSDAFSVMTVNGRLPTSSMGTTLVHEHFLVDFIGADKVTDTRWNRDEVVTRVLPYLLDAKKQGVKTIMDCTPAFLGRDVLLLKRLADQSGLQLLTNTGYYGAVDNKYLPAWAFTETAVQLANRWISEFENGIDNSSIKPGFIKISVAAGQLSALHQKIVKAAALTHLQTGLTICSHTGPAIPAFEEIALLKAAGVHASAFVWTHAQNEQDTSLHVKAAGMGAWISLDGLGWGDIEKYAAAVANLKAAGMLDRVLISHDAGWYRPGEKDGGSFKGFTNIFTELFPVLRRIGFTEKDLEQLLVKNPAEAFAIRVKKG